MFLTVMTKVGKLRISLSICRWRLGRGLVVVNGREVLEFAETLYLRNKPLLLYSTLHLVEH